MDERAEKMSKSRGNVVSIDSMVHRVSSIGRDYEFRDAAGRVVDYDARGVWRMPHEGGYWTEMPNAEPVWLCRIGVAEPPLFPTGEQHPGHPRGV